MMNKHQSRTQVTGDEDLPDLALNMPLPQAYPNPRTVDRASTALFRQHLSYYEKAQDARTDTLTQEGSRTIHRGASASIRPKVHHGKSFDIGHDAKAQNQNAVAWHGREISTCASCSKWSLACIHAAALDAFDEHDSGSDPHEKHAARTPPQFSCPQNAHVKLHAASHRSQHQVPNPPMLQRWLSQSPRQEGFNGIASAEALSGDAIKSHL